jgi:hypothetical protein
MSPLEYAQGRFLYELLSFGVAVVVAVILLFGPIVGHLGRRR